MLKYKKFIIIALVIFTILFVIFGSYKNLVKSENFTESKTKTALSLPKLNKWYFEPSDNWYATKQNGYSIRLRDMGIRPYKNMSISFLFKIKNVAGQWRNVFHFTNTGNNCCSPGDRIPAMWVFPDNTTQLHIRFSTNSGGNDGTDSGTTMALITPVLITLIFNGNNFKFYMNNTLISDRNYNNITERNDNTILYIGNPWDYQDGGLLIKNFTVFDGVLGEHDITSMMDKIEEGVAGPPGSDGAPGAAGAPGASGTPGAPGAQGSEGMPGMPGVPGTDGKQGTAGQKGADGKPGSDGTPGAPGQSGSNGTPGTVGKSGLMDPVTLLQLFQ